MLNLFLLHLLLLLLQVVDVEFGRLLAFCCRGSPSAELLQQQHLECMRSISSGCFLESPTTLQSLNKTLAVVLTFAVHTLKFSSLARRPQLLAAAAAAADGASAAATALLGEEEATAAEDAAAAVAAAAAAGANDGAEGVDAEAVAAQQQQRLQQQRRRDSRLQSFRCAVEAAGFGSMLKTAHAAFVSSQREFVGKQQQQQQQ